MIVNSATLALKTTELPSPGTQRILAGWLRADHFAGYPAHANTPADVARHQASHAAAVRAVSALPKVDLGPTAPEAITDPEEQAWIAEVVASRDYQQHYGHANAIIGCVPIEEITVFQPHLRAHHEAPPLSSLEVLKWCIPKEFGAQMNIRIEGNRILLLGKGPNFQLVPPQADPNGGGILLPIAANANWVQVKRVSGRYILHNGHHRVAALAAAGHTHVPAIVSDAPSLEHVIPLQGNRQYRPWWSPQEIQAFERPPRIVDFFDASVTMDLPAEELMRVVEIRLDIQQFQLPVELK